MVYFDSTYIVRLYYQDPGFEAVRQLAATASVACGQHGRAEVVAALHRKRREGSLSDSLYVIALQQFTAEIRAGAFAWLPLSTAVFARIEKAYASLPADVFLRAADAMHLACAAERGLREVYSNDQRLLAAAAHFGLRAVNVI
jgi:predicted nucleic acid-binding protein